jgi:hypothetical protein
MADKLATLEKKLIEGMPTKSEMKIPSQDNIGKLRAWEDGKLPLIQQWRAARRTKGLDTNLEAIRPA